MRIGRRCWRYSGPAAPGGAPRAGTTVSSSKRCTTSRSTTSPGGLCRTWRALPAACGTWNSIWKRFWRLSQAGVFEAFFDALAAMSQTAHLVQMFDSTLVRAHVSAAGAKGGQDGQAVGRSRGGFSTKIHLKADLDGRPLA